MSTQYLIRVYAPPSAEIGDAIRKAADGYVTAHTSTALDGGRLWTTITLRPSRVSADDVAVEVRQAVGTQATDVTVYDLDSAELAGTAPTDPPKLA